MTFRANLRTLGVAYVLLMGGGTRVAVAAESVAVSASVRPAVATLGERAEYRGRVVVPKGTAVRWLSPETSEPLTWGPRVAARRSGRMDTVTVSVPLQAFELGELVIPGLRFELQPPGQPPVIHRLPMAGLRVVSVLTAADSTGRYRELHGPLAAPWWERVPWLWVTIGLLLIAAAIAWFVWLRRRRPQVVPTPVAIPAPVGRDPSVEALSALAALRARRLPEQGFFADHAFELGQILRRFLEATTASRPGQTTPELVSHLRESGLAESEVTRFRGLLEGWDRVKFAREAPTIDDAARTESAVEAFVRRPHPGREAKVA